MVGDWIVSCKDIPLLACGMTIESACNEFGKMLQSVYNEYVNCDESELTSDALELRNKLLNLTKQKR